MTGRSTESIPPSEVLSSSGHRTIVAIHIIGIGSRVWGPESGEFGFSQELFLLREALALAPLDTGCPARPYFFFEVDGRFADRPMETRLRKCIVYKYGHASAQFEIALKTIQLHYGPRRRVICGLLKEGSEKLAKRLTDKWPEFRSADYLGNVSHCCARFLAFPMLDEG